MTNIDDIPTPELTKQAEARQHGSEEIGEFIEWLGQQGYRICQWREDLTSIQTCYGFDRRGEVISSSQRVYFTVNSFSSASKWDGRPAYQTGSGFGH